MNCPCGSLLSFTTCCEPFLKGTSHPKTAEALMRSRYTAYTLKDISYIQKTLAPESLKDFDVNASREWANQAEWLGLKIVSTKQGSESDKKGVVEFVADFKEKGKTLSHHEVSQFRKNDKDHWMFVDGDAHTHAEGEDHNHHHHEPIAQVVRETPKVGRNDPCTCGSGKKYKKCCATA